MKLLFKINEKNKFIETQNWEQDKKKVQRKTKINRPRFVDMLSKWLE